MLLNNNSTTTRNVFYGEDIDIFGNQNHIRRNMAAFKITSFVK